MKRHVMLAALAAGFVATTSLPAAAQFWGGTWNNPHWGGGVSVGVGTPYAFAGHPGCTCPPWGARVSTVAPAFAYEPGFVPSPGFAFGTTFVDDPGFVDHSYGSSFAVGSRRFATTDVEPRVRRDLSVGVRTSARERFRTRDRIRSDVRTRRDNIRTGFEARDSRFVNTGMQRGIESRSTVGAGATVQGGARMQGNATIGEGRADMRGGARGNGRAMGY
jgi:hypothetical protein